MTGQALSCPQSVTDYLGSPSFGGKVYEVLTSSVGESSHIVNRLTVNEPLAYPLRFLLSCKERSR